MADLQEERGLAYLFVTLDLSLVEVIADTVGVMRDGRIVERGTVTEIFEDPQTDYTRMLLEAIPQPFPPSLLGEAQPELADSI